MVIGRGFSEWNPRGPCESSPAGKAGTGLRLTSVLSLCSSPRSPHSSLFQLPPRFYSDLLQSCLSTCPALFFPQNLALSNLLPCLLPMYYISHFNISEIVPLEYKLHEGKDICFCLCCLFCISSTSSSACYIIGAQ